MFNTNVRYEQAQEVMAAQMMENQRVVNSELLNIISDGVETSVVLVTMVDAEVVIPETMILAQALLPHQHRVTVNPRDVAETTLLV
jgi:hypothetical protein